MSTEFERNKENDTALSLHEMAEKERESGNFELSVDYISRAIDGYIDEKNANGVVEGFASRSITRRLQAEQAQTEEEKQVFISEAFNDASKSVGLGEMLGATGMVLAYYNLAKVEANYGDNNIAIKRYKQALTSLSDHPEQPHNTPSVVADIKIRLAVSELKSGDKSALNRFEESIEELKANPNLDNYAQKVWESGGYMEIAKALFTSDLEKAREYLSKAKNIIDQNPELIIRKKQLDKLSKEFGI